MVPNRGPFYKLENHKGLISMTLITCQSETWANGDTIQRDGNCHIIDLIARYQDQARLKQFVSEQDFKFLDNQQSEPTGPEKPLEPPKFYLRAEQSAGQWKYLRIGETVSQIGT